MKLTLGRSAAGVREAREYAKDCRDHGRSAAFWIAALQGDSGSDADEFKGVELGTIGGRRQARRSDRASWTYHCRWVAADDGLSFAGAVDAAAAADPHIIAATPGDAGCAAETAATGGVVATGSRPVLWASRERRDTLVAHGYFRAVVACDATDDRRRAAHEQAARETHTVLRRQDGESEQHLHESRRGQHLGLRRAAQQGAWVEGQMGGEPVQPRRWCRPSVESRESSADGGDTSTPWSRLRAPESPLSSAAPTSARAAWYLMPWGASRAPLPGRGVYYGGLDHQDCPTGVGRGMFNDGSTYLGQWADGRQAGFGMVHWSAAALAAGSLEGAADATTRDATAAGRWVRYKGTFAAGSPSGAGVFDFGGGRYAEVKLAARGVAGDAPLLTLPGPQQTRVQLPPGCWYLRDIAAALLLVADAAPPPPVPDAVSFGPTGAPAARQAPEEERAVAAAASPVELSPVGMRIADPTELPPAPSPSAEAKAAAAAAAAEAVRAASASVGNARTSSAADAAAPQLSCEVCLMGVATHAVLPCGHRCLCACCAGVSWALGVCPVCLQPKRAVIPTALGR